MYIITYKYNPDDNDEHFSPIDFMDQHLEQFKKDTNNEYLKISYEIIIGKPNQKELVKYEVYIIEDLAKQLFDYSIDRLPISRWVISIN